MPRLSDPPRPTPAPKKRATSAADDDTQNAENNSQQTDRSAAKSQKTSAHSKTVSRVEAKPGVVLSVKMINFKNHSHTFQVAQCSRLQSHPLPPATHPATVDRPRRHRQEFGSHVNFITGENGSGKSAILAAICTCRASHHLLHHHLHDHPQHHHPSSRTTPVSHATTTSSPPHG